MEIKDMNLEQVEERLAAIKTDVDSEGVDLDALEEETRALKDRQAELRKLAEEKREERAKALAEGITIGKEEKEEMPVEKRNAEYAGLFAEYLKTGKYDECRSFMEAHAEEVEVRMLKSENASGQVAVPEFVYDIVKTAWEREGIMRRVKKSYLAGNIKVGFEISGTDAAVHTEGTDGPDEETLVLGILELVPASIKKWITITDEVYDLRGEAFLRYVYNELTYRIAKKAADELIAKIEACGTVSTNTPTTTVGVPKVEVSAIGVGTVAQAIAQLSDEAVDPIVMMNKLTWSEFKNAQYSNGYGVDPFEGLEQEFNSTIKAWSVATTGETVAIVGDLYNGALANFPNGEEIRFKFDDLSLAEDDLIKVVGREYVALGIIGPNQFVKIVKAAAAAED